MDIGAVFAISLVALLFGTTFVCGYTFLLHRAGFSLGMRCRGKNSPWRGTVSLALAFVPIGALFALLPFGPVWLKAVVVCSVYLVHAQPVCVGFCAGWKVGHEQLRRQFKKNVEDWLGEWECRLGEKRYGFGSPLEPDA
ncbi:MAG: hypothetical protein SNJ74_07380 [Fimbriimonadaceae bacterium]